MKVSINLAQESKKGLRSIESVEYSINNEKEVKINIAKFAQTLTNVVFRKLAKQEEMKKKFGKTVSFGVKMSQAFNLSVICEDKFSVNLSDVFMKVADNTKLKVNRKMYKEDVSLAKEYFKESVICILEEAKEIEQDFRGIFE